MIYKIKKKEYNKIKKSAFCHFSGRQSEKRGKYLDLAWERKMLLYMRVTLILFGTVAKSLEWRPEEGEIIGRIETILTTVLLRSA